MHSMRLGQSLAVAVALSLTLLMAGMFGLGVAIQRRAIAPPELDVRFGRSHLVAYTTYTPECARYVTFCPPELIVVPLPEFYVIWALTQSRQPDGMHEVSTRILTLPLRQP